MDVEERLNPSFDWIIIIKKVLFLWDPWLHSNIQFDSKSGLPLMIFFRQVSYGFEAYEVRNPMVKTTCDSLLKRGRYSHLTQSCIEVILLRDCIRVWFFLLVWTHFLGHLLGLKVTELWQLCKSFFWQVLMPNIGAKLKTNGFGSQLESCKKYPLAMGSLFEYFFFILFFYAYCYIACDEKCFESY